jgi:hypothetical protein
MGGTASKRYRQASGHTEDRGPRSMKAIGLKTGCFIPFRSADRQPEQAGRLCHPSPEAAISSG